MHMYSVMQKKQKNEDNNKKRLREEKIKSTYLALEPGVDHILSVLDDVCTANKAGTPVRPVRSEPGIAERAETAVEDDRVDDVIERVMIFAMLIESKHSTVPALVPAITTLSNSARDSTVVDGATVRVFSHVNENGS